MTETMTVKVRPILFKGSMVRAIIDGRKTQTRRVVKPQPEKAPLSPEEPGFLWISDDGRFAQPCPYGKLCDQLWVREKFQWLWATDERPRSKDSPEGWKISYPATDGIQEYHDPSEGILQRCAPSIHMPRWASRLTLAITGLRTQKLQDISEEDAIREGVERVGFAPDGKTPYYRNYTGEGAWASARCSYLTLWESINGGGSWDKNPWVWVITFNRL
jgi:hypothetical protein